MTGTPLFIGSEQIDELNALRDLAAKHPVDARALLKRVQTQKGKAALMAQMTRQSLEIPFGYIVAYSVETNHPSGTFRHASVSSPVPGRVPSPEAIWMICEHLGFVGGIELCLTWAEDLQRGDQRTKAINVMQPLNMDRPHTA